MRRLGLLLAIVLLWPAIAQADTSPSCANLPNLACAVADDTISANWTIATGKTIILSSLAIRSLSQYSSLRLSVALTRGLNSVILNGPLPTGALANSAHDPVLRNCVGLTWRIHVAMFGK